MAGPPRTYVLSDAATTSDQFGSHSRVAGALATLIRNGSPAGRSVALTGPWGSGKSSIIAMLRERLDALRKEGEFEPSIFLFDAWVHQGDPIRRSFLECLIRESGRGDPKRVEHWTEELDRITGRREINTSVANRPLTKWGFALAASVLLGFPMGGALLGRYDPARVDFWKSEFALASLACFSLPFLISLAALLKERNFESLKALMLREARQDTTTTTVRTREPSSTDFRGLFSAILSSTLGDNARRLIVVIDNLDRIDPATAVSMWATMRVFFELGGAGSGWNDRLWLIVPFDRSALRKLWKSDKDDANAAEALIDSFLNKTFQITFPVSAPVLTRWKDYFNGHLAAIFPGAELERDRVFVYRIYSLIGPAAPSPREMKAFVNRLSAMHLLFPPTDPPAERVALPFLAAYLLVNSKVSDSGIEIIDGDLLGPEAITLLSQFDAAADWREQLAAAHFNLNPNLAIQVLLWPRIARAIESGDSDELRQLQSRPYFWAVFDREAANQRGEWINNPLAVSHAATFLQRVQPDPENVPLLENVRHAVIAIARDVNDWTGAGSVEAVLTLPGRVDYSHIAHNVIESLEKQAAQFGESPRPGLEHWVRLLGEALSVIGMRPDEAPDIPEFRFEAAAYLEARLYACRMQRDDVLERNLECSEPVQIPRKLAELMPVSGEDEFLRLQAKLQLQFPEGWEEYDLALANGPLASLPLAIRSLWLHRGDRPLAGEVTDKFRVAALAALPDANPRDAGVLAAGAHLAGHFFTPPPPEMPEALADLGYRFDGNNQDAELLEGLLARGGFARLSPQTVLAAYRKHALPALVQQAAANPEPFVSAGAGSDDAKFFAAWLPLVAEPVREDAAMRFARFYAQVPRLMPKPLMRAVCDICGPAWIAIEDAEKLQSVQTVRDHMDIRIELGDRSSDDLIAQADFANATERTRLLRLALDRARGDVILRDSSANRSNWGRAVLAECRYLAPAAMRPVAERAHKLFEDAGEAGAGAGEALERMSQSSPDAEAMALLGIARQSLEVCVELSPGDPDCLRALATVLISQARRTAPGAERHKLIAGALEALESIPDPSPRTLLVLAICLTDLAMENGPDAASLFDRAAQTAERIIEANPHASYGYRQAGMIGMRRAAFSRGTAAESTLRRARERLEEAISRDPGDYFALCYSGDILLNLARNQPREEGEQLASIALERYQQAQRIDPRSPNAHLGMAWLAHFRAWRAADNEGFAAAAEAAESAARQVLEWKPEEVSAMRLLGRIGVLRALRSARAEADPLFHAAVEQFARAAAIRPEDSDTLTDWSRAFADYGHRRQRADYLGEAYRIALQALKAGPNDPDARVAVAEALRLGARYGADRKAALRDAVEAYEDALKMAPDLDHALVGLAWAQTGLELYEPAESNCRRALDLRPDNEFALEALGDTLASKGRAAEALEAYDRARRLNPQMLHSHIRAAELRLDLGERDAALHALRETAAKFADHADAHLALGRALRRTSSLKESVSALRTAASLATSANIEEELRQAQRELDAASPGGAQRPS